ncbi:MAG: response regulator, partial [Acidobacteria bacterium]|nr:response regulator [Acidobacteriota bacterium]
TAHEEAGGIRLEAEVEDTGPGIPQDEQKELFKPFQQTLNGRLMRSGTGLGLAICKEFVTLLGGDIVLDSRPGRGSIFKFHILAGEGEVGAGEMSKPESRRVKRLRSGQPAPRVLVAADEELSRSFLSKLLGEVGFETRCAVNGKEAIEELEAWRPHLILMDTRMPVMDDCEAARRIRANGGGAEVKIIGVSAGAFAENRREALAAGADDFLTNPFREVVLFDKIKKLLGVEYEFEDGAAGSCGADGSGDAGGASGATSEKERRSRGAGARAAGGGRGAVTAKAVAALPAGFLKRMRQAVIQADYDKIMGLIDGLARRRAPLAEGLRGLVERFEYNTLLGLLPTERKIR